jgi:hypothetical protein
MNNDINIGRYIYFHIKALNLSINSFLVQNQISLLIMESLYTKRTVSPLFNY